jgi:hypothetical protein
MSTCFVNFNHTVLYISFAAIKTTYFGSIPKQAAGERRYQGASTRLENWCPEACCGVVHAVKQLFQYYYLYFLL